MTKPTASSTAQKSESGVDEAEHNENEPLPESSVPTKDIEAGAHASESIKAVAIYEICKGIASLVAAVALWHWHNDITTWLHSITRLWHYYFGQLLVAQIDGFASNAERASRHWIVAVWLILGYASLRFIEAYGLWKDKTWAYWYSVLGYGVFIPIEMYYLITESFDWFKFFIFLLNVVIVIIVYRNMKRKGLLG